MEQLLGPEDEIPAGAIVGDHVVRALIGVGGCAAVYLAEHRETGARSALKILHRRLAVSPKMITRFVREVEAIRLVHHPGIVVVEAIGQLPDGRPYYVMELLEGSTLAALARTRGRFSPGEALEILDPLCAALHEVHRAGIVHRDLKPSNVFIAKVSDRSVVKVLDFGIAKLLRPEPEGEPFTTIGHKLGTPSAMAPEQILGLEVDARADVYALGVLLFRMLTGRSPFLGESLREIEAGHLETPPSRPSRVAPVSRAVDEVVLRCLEKRPDNRYPGVLAFIEDLRRSLDRGTEWARRGAGEPQRALGLHVELHIPAGQEDDALFDDVGAALDTAERTVRDAGYELAVQTGNSLLGVRLLSPACAQLERRRALELAGSLRRSLDARPTADVRVEIQICVHEDGAMVGPSPLGARVAGGPQYLCLGAWVPTGRTGALATRRLLEGLPAGAIPTLGEDTRWAVLAAEVGRDATRVEPASAGRPPAWSLR